MSHPDLERVLSWRGRTVRDRDGEALGKLGDVYLDEDDRPAYGGVRTGIFGRRESVVPVDGMEATDDGLRVPYSAAHVRHAPTVAGEDTLSPFDARRLADHYADGRTCAGLRKAGEI
jgi:hypothetical protein